MTERQESFTYRPSAEAKAHLDALIERWNGCSRSGAINRALAIAFSAGSRPEDSKELYKPKPAYRGFGKQVVDPEKLAEFQRKTGMSSGGGRRNE